MATLEGSHFERYSQANHIGLLGGAKLNFENKLSNYDTLKVDITLKNPVKGQLNTFNVFGQGWHEVTLAQLGNVNIYQPNYGNLVDNKAINKSTVTHEWTGNNPGSAVLKDITLVYTDSRVRNIGIKLATPLILNDSPLTRESAAGEVASSTIPFLESGSRVFIGPKNIITTPANINGVIGLPVQVTTDGFKGGLPFGEGTRFWSPQVDGILPLGRKLSELEKTLDAELFRAQGITLGDIIYLNLYGNIVKNGQVSFRPLQGAVNPTTGYLKFDKAEFATKPDPADQTIRHSEIKITDPKALGFGILFQAPANTSKPIETMNIAFGAGQPAELITSQTTGPDSGRKIATLGEMEMLARLKPSGEIVSKDLVLGDEKFRVYHTQVFFKTSDPFVALPGLTSGSSDSSEAPFETPTQNITALSSLSAHATLAQAIDSQAYLGIVADPASILLGQAQPSIDYSPLYRNATWKAGSGFTGKRLATTIFNNELGEYAGEKGLHIGLSGDIARTEGIKIDNQGNVKTIGAGIYAGLSNYRFGQSEQTIPVFDSTAENKVRMVEGTLHDYWYEGVVKADGGLNIKAGEAGRLTVQGTEIPLESRSLAQPLVTKSGINLPLVTATVDLENFSAKSQTPVSGGTVAGNKESPRALTQKAGTDLFSGPQALIISGSSNLFADRGTIVGEMTNVNFALAGDRDVATTAITTGLTNIVGATGINNGKLSAGTPIYIDASGNVKTENAGVFLKSPEIKATAAVLDVNTRGVQEKEFVFKDITYRGLINKQGGLDITAGRFSDILIGGQSVKLTGQSLDGGKQLVTNGSPLDLVLPFSAQSSGSQPQDTVASFKLDRTLTETEAGKFTGEQRFNFSASTNILSARGTVSGDLSNSGITTLGNKPMAFSAIFDSTGKITSGGTASPSPYGDKMVQFDSTGGVFNGMLIQDGKTLNVQNGKIVQPSDNNFFGVVMQETGKNIVDNIGITPTGVLIQSIGNMVDLLGKATLILARSRGYNSEKISK
ncbi:MAG: hypothetical protein PHU23_17115, partial [Dehalococcoidales bacterium]|nr:hypothetical protein [Dehalococcoidales bacterium]